MAWALLLACLLGAEVALNTPIPRPPAACFVYFKYTPIHGAVGGRSAVHSFSGEWILPHMLLHAHAKPPSRLMRSHDESAFSAWRSDVYIYRSIKKQKNE